MHLTYYTDYALRVLMYLVIRRGRIANISEIAERHGISRNHLVKVVHNLARGGFIKSYRGKDGGIELARDPIQINIGEVLRYTEGPFKPADCFDTERNRRVITNLCGMADVLEEACDTFFATLDRYTLADLVKRRERLTRLLAPRPGLNRAGAPNRGQLFSAKDVEPEKTNAGDDKAFNGIRYDIQKSPDSRSQQQHPSAADQRRLVPPS